MDRNRAAKWFKLATQGLCYFAVVGLRGAGQLVTTAGLVLVLRAFASELGLVDRPGGRKQHETPTPVVGGIAMFAAVAIVLLDCGSCTEKKSVLLWSAAALMLPGLIDDRFGLNVSDQTL